MFWKTHFDFWSYMVALIASANYSIFLVLACSRFKNTYLSYFSIAYFATTCMLVSNFVDYYSFHFTGEQIEWIHIPLLLCMTAILLGATSLLSLLLEEIIATKILMVLRFSSVVPLIFLFATLFIKDREVLIQVFLIASITFYVILGMGCILFGKALNRLTIAYKKLARNVWLILSFCIVIFIAHGVFQLQFNPLVLFYILLNVALTRFVWNHWGKKLGEVSSETKMQGYSLTEREKEIVKLIVLGKTNKIIGEKLFISDNTVKNHIYNIYKKLEIKSRFELMSLFGSNE